MKHSRLTLGATALVWLLALAGGGLASAQTLTPSRITIGPDSPVFSGGSQTESVQITLPSASIGAKIDVFFLLDDTGSFKDWVPSLTNTFSGLVASLQAAMPGVDFGFGVGRFEDFGGPGASFSGDDMRARPFVLNQPIINAATAGGDANRDALINAGLSHTAAGYGGDEPESSLCEGLFQTATGTGFDGDGNGSMLDSGAAGVLETQTAPGTSGDVPPFSSNVLPASGTLGGAGFRSDALRLVIMASDVCPVAPFPAGSQIPENLTNASGLAIPTSAFVCSTAFGSSRFGWVSDAKSTAANTVPFAVAPSDSGTVQGTINALNAQGIRVICMGPNAAPTESTTPTSEASTWFSAIARLTGAVDASGQPLVFSTSVDLTNLTLSIVSAISNAVTSPINLTLAASPGLPPGLCMSSVPTVISNVAPGGTAGFSVSFYGCGEPTGGTFNLNFVAVGSGSVLGGIPVDFVPPSGGCVPTVHASVVETNSLRVRQTGLFYQTVGVTNNCGVGISALRLYLEGLPDGVQVYNASGTSDGVPYLLYNAPVAANGGIEFAVEYYVPSRRIIPNPTFRAEAVPTDLPVTPDGTVQSTLRILSYSNCAVLVEFSTVSGGTYYVQYTADPGANAVWETASPAITGNGTSVQWLDSGPPKTDSPPCSQPARYYRVLVIP